jgi:membrane associated rhomboid family serine protease
MRFTRSANGSRTIRDELWGILVFVGIIWTVFLISTFFPAIKEYGLQPRTAPGLVGVVSMPFLHQNLGHIIGNTIPLVVLLTLVAGSRARTWEYVAEIVIIGGALLWLIGRNANHIGASGLVFGLIAFLILAGVFERRPIPILIAIITFFLYGGTLLWGFVPLDSSVSWDGHLCGSAAGGLLAFRLARKPRGKARITNEPGDV